MKKCNFIFSLFLLVFLSCDQQTETSTNQPSQSAPQTGEKVKPIRFTNIEVFEYEGCEYITLKNKEGSNLGYGFMAHKGNCKNPIHCYMKSDSLETILE